MGVNVNIEANRVADVKAATEKWKLGEIPTWHFLTGSAEELEPVWKAYGVAVIPASNGEDLGHSSGIYLIDRLGQARWYISVPLDPTGAPAEGMPLL
ncbi:MAG: SCO family protein, partial [Anaerolineales bacterium]